MKLSRTVAYAVQATLQLAQTDSAAPIPCSQLAAAGKMPERFLLQVLRQLVMHGILHSTRGVDGGYALNRKAEDIALLEVIEAIDGPLLTPLPDADNGEVLPYEARLREVLTEITTQCRRKLQAISIADLLKGPSGN